MNVVRARLVAGLFAASIIIATPCAFALSAADPDGPVNVLTYLQVSSSTLTSPPAGWSFGHNSSGSLSVASMPAPADATSSAAIVANSYVLDGGYPSSPPSGGEYMSAYYDVLNSTQTEDLYIEFWAKMPGATGGFKFVKVFGQRLTPTSYADVTFPADYTGIDPGALWGAYFGDGSAITNDAQNSIFFNGSDPTSIGRSYGIASVQTPQMKDFPSSAWGSSWHHFRIHVKFNSGTTSSNEVANGEIYMEVDGKVYVDATGLYDRNPANGPIETVEFFGWAQNDSTPFQIYYDDIRISTGGFVPQDLPAPPGDVQVH